MSLVPVARLSSCRTGGRFPHRVSAATKAGLLEALDEDLGAGWTLRRACAVLDLPVRRAHRWLAARRDAGGLADRRPGGSPVHGLLEEEVEAILALFEQWGEVDRSHRQLAHRGSYLGRFWVSPSSVRRVLVLADKHFRPLPRPGKSERKRFPGWAESFNGHLKGEYPHLLAITDWPPYASLARRPRRCRWRPRTV